MLVLWVWAAGAAAAVALGPLPSWWRREFTGPTGRDLTGGQAWTLWAVAWAAWPVTLVLAARHALYKTPRR